MKGDDMKIEYSYLQQQFALGKESKMKVNYVELPKGANADEILAAVREQLKICNFTLGPEVSQFEQKFAQVCQTRHAIGVNSGTDALILSLKSLDIGQSDEVITAPNSFIATAGAIVMAGARPVFVDVSDDYNINPDLIVSAITPRTKAIIPVHLTGNPADMPRIMGIAKEANIAVIEDACQAIGASINGQPVGSFGITAAFSLHPLKNLNVWGDGGVITTNSSELEQRLRLMRNHGLRNRDEVDFFAYNSRLDTVQAIVGLKLLLFLDIITETRIKHARFYDEALKDLADFITIPQRKPSVRQVFHTYVIQAKERDELFQYLNDNGVEAKIHYPIPIHLQRAAQYLGYYEGDFPITEAQARSIITLPVHQHLSQDQLEYVVSTVKKFYSKNSAKKRAKPARLDLSCEKLAKTRERGVYA
jgi:dTDP-4-amino-4,6-dideoxygalactose transaminase